MAFYADGRHGLALSDPVDGKFRILATRDRGRSWSVLPSDGMPEASTEFGFAASGDCLVTAGRTAYFGSGGGAARVFRSDDCGLTWTAADSAIPAGDAAGGFALAFRTPREGIAVGGDFADRPTVSRPTATPATAGPGATAATCPTWARTSPTCAARGTPSSPASPAGDRVQHQHRRRAHLEAAIRNGYHALDCDGTTCWAAGGNGRVGHN